MQSEKNPPSRREGLIAAAMFAAFASFVLFGVLTHGDGRPEPLLMFLALCAAGGGYALRAFFPHLYNPHRKNEKLGVRLLEMALLLVALSSLAGFLFLGALGDAPWPMRVLFGAVALVFFGAALLIVVRASVMVMRRLRHPHDQ